MATGWAAFGIAEAGGMFGADIVSFTTANPNVLVDGYILDDRQVRVDNNSQDWTLISSVVEDGWIIVEATRKITTGDTQDNALKNDKELWGAPTRLIAAWGDTEEMSYHGDNRSSSSVRIFADPSSNSLESDAVVNALEKNSDGYFDVVNGAYEIPARETDYEYICKSYDELKEQFGGDMTDITMIAATPIITEETRQFVHHFIAMAIPSCDNQDRFKREQIYGWAPGDVGMVLPDDVGFPMFDTEDNQAIMIEIHYNNPKLISGMEDSSGVRFYYTNAPRLHDAAILMLGDPMLGLYGVAINDGLTMHEFSCPGECSSLFLDEPVTVISEKLHMHKTGVRMVNEAIRGGEVFHTATVEIFDFEQQGEFVLSDIVPSLLCPSKKCSHILSQEDSNRSKIHISCKLVTSFVQLATTKMALYSKKARKMKCVSHSYCITQEKSMLEFHSFARILVDFLVPRSMFLPT